VVKKSINALIVLTVLGFVLFKADLISKFLSFIFSGASKGISVLQGKDVKE